MRPFAFALLFLATLSPSLSWGQNDCLNEALVVVNTDVWANELSWSIVNSANEVVASGADYQNGIEEVTAVCLEDSCYTLLLFDSFGDGWNGASIWVNFEDAGVMIGPLTMNTGGEAAFAIGISPECNGVSLDNPDDNNGGNSIWGCTDALSPNYNPDATIDDGSCISDCECPEVDDPVCGYNPFTGEVQTFGNLCELECLGAYLQWEGDCNEVPVYGCQDPEALNFDPAATSDSGNCVYLPECGDLNFVSLSSTSVVDSIFGGFAAQGQFTGQDGNPVALTTLYDNDGAYTAFGCMDDGCYNFVVLSNGWYGGSISVSVNGAFDSSYALDSTANYGLFAFGLGVDDCETFIPGCTDPEASNYFAEATEDDGSCIYPISCNDGELPAQLYICTFSDGDEVALSIEDSEGNVIFAQAGFPNLTIDYLDICLDPEECYTATMSNIGGGDSWNGGYFWIESANFEWVNGALNGASDEILGFGTGDGCDNGSSGGGSGGGDSLFYGCTDPLASNYNPFAIEDDGSCEYPQTLDCTGENAVSIWYINGNDPFFNEVSWTILDDEGNLMAFGNGSGQDNPNGGDIYSMCMPDGCYSIELYDSWGDGWGSGTLMMTANDTTYAYSLDTTSGDFAAYPVELGAGCSEDEPGATGDGITNASMSTWPDLASLTVYPTPSEDVVNIVGNGFDSESPVTVRVRDGIGRITAVKTMPANAGQARWTLDASSWATGIYTVEGTQKDVRAVSRIVVTR